MTILTIKAVAALLLLGLIGYLVLLSLLYLKQPALIYLPDMPTRQQVATPLNVGLDYRPVTLIAEDGIKLDGWFLPVEAPRATLLFFHGNAGNISHRLESLDFFHSLGLAVFILDYRGYGRSEGSPSEVGTYKDAEAAWRYLTETRGLSPSEILLFGRSLGGAMAAYLASRHKAMGLVLESTFTSVPALAAEHYPWVPVRWLIRYHYPTLERLPGLRMPLWIVHSNEDEIVPFSHGQALYEAAGEPKRLLEIRGGHNDPVGWRGEAYRRGWQAFIDLAGANVSSGNAMIVPGSLPGVAGPQ